MLRAAGYSQEQITEYPRLETFREQDIGLITIFHGLGMGYVKPEYSPYTLIAQWTCGDTARNERD